MTEDTKEGLSTALDAVMDGAPEPPVPIPEQAKLPLEPVGEAVKSAQQPAGERRGRGRPAGSRNKRTQEWADFLLAQYPSPLIVLAEIMSRPLDELKQELGCDKAEALKIQVSAAERLLPYTHQKQPMAVNVDAKGVVQLILTPGAPMDPGAIEDDDAISAEVTVIDHEPQQNQALTDGSASELDKGELDK